MMTFTSVLRKFSRSLCGNLLLALEVDGPAQLSSIWSSRVPFLPKRSMYSAKVFKSVKLVIGRGSWNISVVRVKMLKYLSRKKLHAVSSHVTVSRINFSFAIKKLTALVLCHHNKSHWLFQDYSMNFFYILNNMLINSNFPLHVHWTFLKGKKNEMMIKKKTEYKTISENLKIHNEKC